ncbi:uncharacterized protein BDV14DRAFT_204710 [Aspergillus stella-maris]|uniref:uncharacterized protein n=1 Tax=Aspergillus stella-maris TaxID=1810926 RepID=UPI003CCD58F6
MSDTPISTSPPNPVLRELFFDRPLNLFLSPVRGPHDPNPTRHWLLILSPPNGLHATFYHILKDPVETRRSFAPIMYRYRRGPVLPNVPLHSTIPISNGRASPNKIGVVVRSAHDTILELAEETMSLLASERHGVYHRFVEPVRIDDLSDLMGGMEIERGVREEELMEMMGEMELGGCGYASKEEEREFMGDIMGEREGETGGEMDYDSLFGSPLLWGDGRAIT